MGAMNDTDLSNPTWLAQHADYQRVRQAIEFLSAHWRRQPELAELAAHLGLSEAHLHKLFSRWAGVSPKRFVQSLTKAHAKALLRQHSVLDTALAVGLSGPSRLHDLMVVHEAVTPGEYQRQGAGLCVRWGVHPSPLGEVLLAVAPRGVCFLAFFDTPDERLQAEHDLRQAWGRALLVHEPEATVPWVQRVFAPWSAAEWGTSPRAPLPVLLKGSPFQLQVWEALLRLPPGGVCSYGDLAARLGQPSATRAVASAVARNQIGWLIPCHRVIRASGEVHDYRWGSDRKKALLAWESAAVRLDSPAGCVMVEPCNVAQTSVTEQEQSMAGWFELSKSSDGQFRFVLKAGNAETILSSELYKTRAAAENGIASVQKNAPDDTRYERKTASNGKFHFNLKAANHQVIGSSQLYASEASRDNGIASVQTNGVSTTIKDLTA